MKVVLELVTIGFLERVYYILIKIFRKLSLYGRNHQEWNIRKMANMYHPWHQAAKQIIGLAAKGDNKGYVNAINRLNSWADTVIEAKKAYMKRRGFDFKDSTDNKDDPLGLR